MKTWNGGIGDDGDIGDQWYWWSIESKTKDKVVESETEEDIEENHSCESEGNKPTGSVANGRKAKTKVKRKKANFSRSKEK